MEERGESDVRKSRKAKIEEQDWKKRRKRRKITEEREKKKK